MKIQTLIVAASSAAFFLSACSGAKTHDEPVEQADTSPDASDSAADMEAAQTYRFATFNTSLFRSAEGQLITDLESGEDAQAKQIAEVIQKIRPDVILLNEFDYDESGKSIAAFKAKYLEVSQNGREAIEYEYSWVFASNTGVHSGFDLDNDGNISATPGTRAYGGDAYGYGEFEGQYGFAVLSRFPQTSVRTFQNFLWKDMPDTQIPSPWYSQEEQDVFRLSSKNHVDLALDVEGTEVHLLASHPTPPGFDGDEDRNGKRNHDEVRFWQDYINGADYFVDDAGATGALASEAHFVIVGDLNMDPVDGDASHDPIVGILNHERVANLEPKSLGGPEASAAQGGANTNHKGDPALDTGDFSDNVVGNLRVDYAIPSKSLKPTDTGVFWPSSAEEDAELAGASDHHLVWVDLQP